MAPRLSRRVRVVTDSTASLPPDLTAELGVEVVPLQVVIGEDVRREGVDPVDVVGAISAGLPVSTSQPSPQAFADVYAAAAAQGAREIVSVHLSGDLSGTVHAAALAAVGAPVPVRVVDSRTVGMGLGFAVREAALLAGSGTGEGPRGLEVAQRALVVASTSRAVFLVESLDHLRRGGRLSAPAAAVGSMLGLRPLLRVRDGRIEVVQKVRSRAAAVQRVTDVIAESAARRSRPEIAVHHLGDDTTAREVAAELADRTGAPTVLTPVSAVLGAHVGPGLLAVIVTDTSPALR